MNQISKKVNSLDVNQEEMLSGKPLKSPMEAECKWDYGQTLGMIGRLPHFNRGKKLREVSRANRYLAIQEKRIQKSIEEGKIKKAVLIGLCLTKTSRSYQMLLFNRVVKGGYGRGPTSQVEETLLGAINKMRSGDMKLLINRFYIMKKNGKMRPIGAPNYESRMISKAMTDLVYAVTEKGRVDEQHGYMKKRGAGSAILQCIRLLKKGYAGYEFDLKSFFNTVEPFIVFRKLEEINKELAILISNIIKNIEYRFSELQEESELHPKAKRKNTLVRTGMPQGLSLSPLLSTGALEYYGRPENLVMYADDGIYFFKHNISKFERGIEKMGRAGIEIAPEKSGSLPLEFKFCGVEISQTLKQVKFENETCGGEDEEKLEKGLKTINNTVYRKDKGGSGEVESESYITHRILTLSWGMKIKVTCYSYGHAKPYQGYRKFPGKSGIFDILTSSSGSVNDMLKELKYKRSKMSRIKPFEISVKKIDAFSYAPQLKGTYRRHYNNGKIGNTKNKQYYGEIMEFHNLKRGQLRAIIE